MFPRQGTSLDLDLAPFNTGNSRPARIAMIAIVTSNSIRVKPAPDRALLTGRTRLSDGFLFLSRLMLGRELPRHVALTFGDYSVGAGNGISKNAFWALKLTPTTYP